MSYQIDTTAKDFPVLRSAGEYGPGRTHEADCEIVEFEIPALEGPGYDRNCERDQYAFFKVRVASEEFGTVMLFHHEKIGSNTGSKAQPWLSALGHCSVSGKIEDQDVPGTKCGVEVTDPRQDKNDQDKFWNGNIRNIFAV